MNRSTCLAAVTLALITASLVGCDPASLSYFLFKGDGKAPPDCPALVAPEGRKDIRVVILIAAPNAPVEFAGIDRDLTRRLADILTEQSKEGHHPIRVVDPSRVEKFKLTTPGWRTLSPAEIGKQLGADYVIDAKVISLSLYDPNSGRLLYQGRGSVEAEVFETVAGRKHCEYAVNTLLDSRPAESLPAGQYRTQLIQRIADEMSWKHLPHVTDRRVAPVQ